MRIKWDSTCRVLIRALAHSRALELLMFTACVYWCFLLMLKLKLQYFGHLMWRADSLKRPRCWERLRAGGEGDDRGWDGWMASPTWWTWVWVDCGSWWRTGRPGVLLFMGSQRVGHDWATELNWMTACVLNWICMYSLLLSKNKIPWHFLCYIIEPLLFCGST